MNREQRNPEPQSSSSQTAPAVLSDLTCPHCGKPVNDRPRYLSLEEVLALTGIKSKWTLKSMRERGDFPEPLALGPRLRVYREDEILTWLDNRPRVKVTLRVRNGKTGGTTRPCAGA